MNELFKTCSVCGDFIYLEEEHNCSVIVTEDQREKFFESEGWYASDNCIMQWLRARQN